MPSNTKNLRAAVPEMVRIVEEVSPALWEMNAEDRIEAVPQEWRALVDGLRQKVHEDAAKWLKEFPQDGEKRSPEERLGYYWHFAIARVDDMIEFLLREIRRDIGVEEEADLASMILVRKAMLQLNIELQNGRVEPRHDDEEHRFRVFKALEALSPRFDDVHLRRFRAVAVGRVCANQTAGRAVQDVEGILEEMRKDGESADEIERRRRWFSVDRPVMDGVIARHWLAEIDQSFHSLDPLVVREEFEAAERTTGGKAEGGEGKTGPVRAVARLAVMCGALDYEQRDGEDFDAAVERARGNLNVTCSRVRKALRAFPGQIPPVDSD